MTQAEGDLVQEPDPFIFNKSNRQCAFSPRSHIIKNQKNKKKQGKSPFSQTAGLLNVFKWQLSRLTLSFLEMVESENPMVFTE